MKQKGILFLVVATMLAGMQTASGQDAHFSQYLNADMYLNPALTSSFRSANFSLNYRNQWSSLVSPYTTAQLTAIKPLYTGNKYKKLGSLAASVYQDKSGDGILKEVGGALNGSYNLQLTSLNSFYAGFQIGFVQKSLDYSNASWGNQYTTSGYDPAKDPEVDVKNNSKLLPDMSMGIAYAFNPSRDYSRHGASYSTRVGFSVYHLNTPNQSYYFGDASSRLPMLMKVHGDIEFNIAKNFYVLPNVLYQTQKGIYQLNTGVNVSYHLKRSNREGLKPTVLTAGTLYRFKDSFIFLAGFGNQAYTIGLSYDLTTTFVREYAYSTGAYEISLRVHPFKEKKTTSYFYYHRKI